MSRKGQRGDMPPEVGRAIFENEVFEWNTNKVN